MLVLSRRTTEQIVIVSPTGDEIRITLLAAHGDHGRIGIDAPLEYAVDREEVFEAKRRAA